MMFSTKTLIVLEALLLTRILSSSATNDCSDSICQDNVQCVREDIIEEGEFDEPDCNCYCNHGFVCGENGNTCDDIDECDWGPCLFDQVCVNTYGGYKCVCKPDTPCDAYNEINSSVCPECVESADCSYCTDFTCQSPDDREDSDRCDVCPAGTFAIDEVCEICPPGSYSFTPGLSECPCLPNYYRAPSDPTHSDCTRLPSKPRNLKVNATNTTMVVTWLQPESLGGRDASELFYFVTITIAGKNERVLESHIFKTTVNVTAGLIPATRYRVIVAAYNRLYETDNTTNSYVTTVVTLMEGVGGLVEFESGVSFFNKLSWNPPNPPNGQIHNYTIRVKDQVGEIPPIIEGINETNFDVRDHVNSSGDYYVEIQAVTSIGGGPFSFPVLVIVHFNDSNPIEITLPTVVAYKNEVLFSLLSIAPIIIVAVTVVIFSLLYYRRYKRRQMKKRRFRETIALTHGRSQQSMTSLASIAADNVGDDCEDCSTLEALSQQRDRAKSNKYIKRGDEKSSLSQLEELSRHIPKDIILCRDNIQLSNVIGQGEFGQVYKGYMKTAYMTDVVAVKTLRALSSSGDVKLLMKEVVKMVHFDHPNVMTLLGVILVEGGAPLLVMPYMTKGTLLAYVRENKNSLFLDDSTNQEQVETVSKTLTEFARQIALGMQYLAANKVVHRDLAARNCLLDMSGTVKVADFGLSEDMYSTNYFRQSKGISEVETKVPIRWMPLESIEEGLYTEKSDVWSYGVTVWEIFTAGKVPYHGISCMALPGLLRAGEHLERPFNSACSDQMYSVLENCWKLTPQMRPRFSEISRQIDAMMEERFGYLIMNQGN